MTFFNASEPLIRCKQEHLDVQDREGLLQLRWQIGNITLFSGLYTRIDQTFLLWGLVTGGIFFTAQFFPISWSFQAILWSTDSNWHGGDGGFDFVLGKSRAS